MYLHNIDPFFIQFHESFGIRWYGLSYLLSFFLLYLFILEISKRNLSFFKNKKLISDFITYGAFGAILGGRFGYMLFYRPESIFEISNSFPYLEILSIHKGGMSSHGGMIGVCLSCFLFSKKHKIPLLHLFDLGAFGASIGFFLGRIANFINGELYGRISSPDFIFSVKFPLEILIWPYHEKFKNSLASLKELMPFIGKKKEDWLFFLENSQYGKIQESLHQIIDQIYLHSNTSLLKALSFYLHPRYPSQLIQAFLEGFLVFLILMILWMYPRKLGFISASFLFLYSLMRIIGENFRLPDLHIGFDLFGLTRGQILSICGLFISLLCFYFIVSKQKVKKGGFLKS